MNKEEALTLLTSSSSHERFRAAHALTKLATLEDTPILQRTLRSETDAYVIIRLKAAIASATATTPKVEAIQNLSDEPHNAELITQARAQAIEWVAGLLLHEIGSKLGLAALTASSEVANYEQSQTKRHITNLQAIFDAIEQLRSAANPAQYDQFDLAELIEETCAIENNESTIEFSLVGLRPLVITGSRQLLRLALCNGIRNSIESLKSAPATETSQSTPIVVAWGSSDSDNWISVLDNGIGIIGSSKSVFEIGKSTKTGHPGFGLAIAKQAMETLSGTVTLEPSAGHGAKYELRWRNAQ